MTEAEEVAAVRHLIEMPRVMSAVLNSIQPQIETLARDLSKCRDVLYLGRGTSYPLALEGALKLKEISYIHAEGYAAGELKHGPIALIDEDMPVIVIAPHDRFFEKTVSNMQEVAARGGRIVFITDAKGAAASTLETVATIVLPEVDEIISPMIYSLPVQLIAYHTAVFMAPMWISRGTLPSRSRSSDLLRRRGDPAPSSRSAASRAARACNRQA